MIDDLVKNRHPGESRGPVLINPLIFLDTGFRRYDVRGGISTFYEVVMVVFIRKTERAFTCFPFDIPMNTLHYPRSSGWRAFRMRITSFFGGNRV